MFLQPSFHRPQTLVTFKSEVDGTPAQFLFRTVEEFDRTVPAEQGDCQTGDRTLSLCSLS